MKIDKGRIEKFIREKVEQEALTDAGIARLLDVATSTANHWRNAFGIKPADKFQRKFKEKYGSDALERFGMMVKNRATLQEIGDHFRFSKEYARQVFVKIYGVTNDRRRHRNSSPAPAMERALRIIASAQ